MHIVVYGTINETEDDGYYFDYTYFGGLANTPTEAENIARDIINDNTIPGHKITKILPYKGQLDQLMIIINKQYCHQAQAIYESEEIQKRHKRKRKITQGDKQ